MVGLEVIFPSALLRDWRWWPAGSLSRPHLRAVARSQEVLLVADPPSTSFYLAVRLSLPTIWSFTNREKAQGWRIDLLARSNGTDRYDRPRITGLLPLVPQTPGGASHRGVFLLWDDQGTTTLMAAYLRQALHLKVVSGELCQAGKLAASSRTSGPDRPGP